MSQIQIIRLSKQINIKEEDHKKQRSILLQKIQLLQAEILEYQDKQQKHRQLNDSIMMTYRQNQSYLEQVNHREINSINNKHQEQIKKIKAKHFQQKKKLQEQKNLLRTENDKLKIDIQRLNFQSQKKIAQIHSKFDQKLKQKEEDYENITRHKLQIMNERLRQSQDMNKFYRQNYQNKKISKDMTCYDQLGQNKYLSKVMHDKDGNLMKAQKNNEDGYRKLKKTQQTLSSINLRINRALVQLNPNHRKLQDRIRQIKFKMNS